MPHQCGKKSFEHVVCSSTVDSTVGRHFGFSFNKPEVLSVKNFRLKIINN